MESEVKRALRDDSDFLDVPKKTKWHFLKASGLFRDSIDDDRVSWVVTDGNYISARWPGDVHAMARKLISKLNHTK